MSDALNRWLYRTGERTLTRLARGVDRREVFEAGAGTGYWTAYWLRHGARRVDGCDLVPVAVDRLNDIFALHGRFVVADLGGERPPASREYPLVTAMNVLLHIVDEDAFDRALRHLAALVRPGGHLLIADPVLLSGSPMVSETSRTRPLHRYTQTLGAAGLRLVRVAPTTVLGADPIESGGRWEERFSRTWWRWVNGADRRGTGSLIGRAIYWLDPFALRTGWAPSGKFVLFERPVPRPDA